MYRQSSTTTAVGLAPSANAAAIAARERHQAAARDDGRAPPSASASIAPSSGSS